MEGKKIDGASLAVDRVGSLDRRFPSEFFERHNRRAKDPRMAFVDQPIECSAPPSSVDIGANLENAEDSTERTQGEALEVATLNRRDGRLRQLGRGGQVGLAPAATAAKGADDQADASIVHPGTLTGVTYLGRIGEAETRRRLTLAVPSGNRVALDRSPLDARHCAGAGRPIFESDSQRDVQED